MSIFLNFSNFEKNFTHIFVCGKKNVGKKSFISKFVFGRKYYSNFFENKSIVHSNLSKYENLIQVDKVKKNNEKNEDNFKNNTFKQALYKVELEKKQDKK